MRSYALSALVLLALAAPMAARAQDPGALPADLAQRVTAILNDADTRRYEGNAEIESGDEVEGDVAVLDGSLTLSGRVDGDVVVVNGNLHLGGGAEITGDVIVVGGDIAGQDEAAVTGEMVVFAEPVSHCRRGDLVDVSGDCSRLASVEEQGVLDIGIQAARAEDDWEVRDYGRGHAQFVLAAGRSYNRVEGLPIKFGPAVETGGSNPLRVRALAVFRTEEGGDLGAERWGYDARIEQFIGGRRAFRVGGRAFAVVDPIEGWQVSDLENSLSTFFLHQDHRDHFYRRGWTAFATLAPRGWPLSGTVEYREERHRSVEAGSPLALFKNDDPWRPQPLVGEGRLTSVAGILEVDSRSDQSDPSNGWYVRGELEHALRSTLTRPLATSQDQPFAVPSELFDGDWLVGTLDIRRYNRISPSSRLNLRLAGGASINGHELPPQRQHALGGEGTLPGFPLFSVDCGARTASVSRGLEAEGRFYPSYGCDSFALFQVEYRGDVSFRVDLGGWGEDEDAEYEDGQGEWSSGIAADFGWVFFMDAGRGWTGVGGYDEETAVDLGAGINVGDLGVYFAVPVGGDRDRGGLNFFVRLAPRF
jgi:cytoskeletal protein CcmA (bactofilin family)